MAFVQAVVITDNRLCRLRNGIIYHKYNRKEIAGNAECRHSVFLQIMDEHLVADKHHAGNRHLAQEGGGTQSAHIANVAAHQLHAFPAHLNGVEAQCAPAAQ